MKETVSVITICFNNLEDLIKTCESVDKQTQLPYEHLIIDGSTTKNIIDWLQSASQPSYRRWIHERDNGISDAFNKGWSNANGGLIQFLNAGDIYYDNAVLAKVTAAFGAETSVQWIHGKMQMHRGGQTVIIGKPFEKKKMYRGMRSTFHPTMFVRKRLFEKYGGFDTSLAIAMDYDFLLRIANEKFYFLPEPLISFDPHGISNKKYLPSLKENKLCYEKYYGRSFNLGFWQLRLKLLHFLLQSPLGRLLYKIKKGLGLENL